MAILLHARLCVWDVDAIYHHVFMTSIKWISFAGSTLKGVMEVKY